MIKFLLRILISITLSIYFRRYSIKGLRNLKGKKPMILAMNHPNAFMDPVAFSILAWPYDTYYLARGDAFKPGLAAYLLTRIGIVPIFRIQDAGKEGLKKNDETYRLVNRLLSKKKKIIIFAEGLCIQERRLRPVKKGVPRMVFGAMEEINDPELLVVPVGVNYDRPSKFRSSIFINIGEPIPVKDYMQQYNEQPARTMNVFIQDLEPKMKELITHINNRENDNLVPQLEEMYMKDWCEKQQLNHKDPSQAYEVTKQITEIVNSADEWHPEPLKQLREKCGFYFSQLERLNIRDWLINPENKKKVNGLNVMLRFILMILGFPIYIRGLIGNYLPYKLTEVIIRKKVKVVEFVASFTLGIGSFLFLFYYIIQFYIVYLISSNIGWPALFILVSAVTGLIGLFYHTFMRKTLGMNRALKNEKRIDELRLLRKEIDDAFEQINKNL